MSFVEVRDLKFTYPGAARPTLDIPEFKIEKGERIFLFGPSGSGKTTLLEILAGVLAPQSGRLEIAGTALPELSASGRDHFRAEKMAYIFQNFNLIPYLSVEENILLPSQLRGRRVSDEKVHALAKALGIEDLLPAPVTQMSVGQQQRVAVARALLHSPELILADEPTSALDFDARENFLKLLFELCQKSQITLIFVSHDRSLKNLFSRQVELSQIQRGLR